MCCRTSDDLMASDCFCAQLAFHIRFEVPGRLERRRTLHYNSVVHLGDCWRQVWFHWAAPACNTFYFLFQCSSIRGRLGSVFVFATGTGILFAYTCGAFLSYTALPYVFMPLTLLFLIGTMFHPESAHFLVKEKRNDVSEFNREAFTLL